MATRLLRQGHRFPMDELFRIETDLLGRLTGPFAFRFVLQPLMAAVFALRDGLRDARLDHPPYLKTLIAAPAERRHLIGEAWRAIGRVVVLGVLMDVAYQVIVFKRFYPFELLDMVLLLAVAPYMLLRGPVAAVVRWRHRRRISE